MHWPSHPFGAAVLGWLALTVLFSTGCATAGSTRAAESQEAPGAEERFGIESLGVRLSAAGTMLDLRLRVRSREKAAPLFVRKAASYLVAEETGAVLRVARSPKIGALRATVRTAEMVKQGRVYATLFANPGRLVKAGDTVTVVLGDYRAEHVVVR
jgi:hypothetical protein